MKRHAFSTRLPALALSLACASSALAAGEHRELGAHEHGHGTLNIAIEGKTVKIELEAPGADIAGFEHEPSSDAEKKTFEAAKATLAKPLELFAPPDAAKCSVKEAKVSVVEEEHDDDHKGEHKDDHKDEHKDEHKDAHKDGHDDHKGEKEAEAHHNAFDVDYTLECAEIGALTSLDLKYFAAFPKAQRLTVNVITEKGQGQFEGSPKAPKIDLSSVLE